MNTWEYHGHQSSTWFQERYDDAANQVIEFFGGDFFTLTGRSVADIGCGDGIIDLGVAHKSLPSRLVGFDTTPTDPSLLLSLAHREGVAEELPACLHFVTSQEDRIPAEDDSFDYVFSWSAFEHVQHPAAVLEEIHRVLRPNGVLMVHVYPFFYSQHGSHLVHWYPDGFAQLLHSFDEIQDRIRSEPAAGPQRAEAAIAEYRKLNRITLDGLQEALRLGGFRVSKLEVIAGPIHIPAEISEIPLSMLAVEGAKLLAVPESRTPIPPVR
jgi:ubiquinone/menaquinone biosynthesis C-methylase UbiE